MSIDPNDDDLNKIMKHQNEHSVSLILREAESANSKRRSSMQETSSPMIDTQQDFNKRKRSNMKIEEPSESDSNLMHAEESSYSIGTSSE